MSNPISLLAKLAAGSIPGCRPWRQRPSQVSGSRSDAGSAFDALTRLAAEELPRREALRRLGGGLAIVLLASLGLERAWGQSGTVSCGSYCNQRLPPGRERGRCAASCDSCQSSGGIVCGTSVGGSVICCSGGPTSTCCNGACVDTTTDPNNCGACGNVVDIQTDPNNCGGCGVPCTGGKVCVSGTCQYPATWAECGGVWVDTDSDVNNCGACGNACPSESCVDESLYQASPGLYVMQMPTCTAGRCQYTWMWDNCTVSKNICVDGACVAPS